MEKTLKEFFDNYYIIPKDITFINGIDYEEDEVEEFLKELSINDCYDEQTLKNACIVPRKIGKKLSLEQVEQIKNDKRNYRALAKDYNISLGTISKIKNNIY